MKDSWREQAACRGGKLYKYFDPKPEGAPRNRDWHPHRVALAICRSCPVLLECRDWALHQYECDGSVAGGLTGPQRRRIRQELLLDRPVLRNLTPCGRHTLDGICMCDIQKERSA